MRLHWPCLTATTVLVACLLVPGDGAEAESPDSTKATTVGSINPATSERKEQSTADSVVDWFDKYDQIRRDAEMTLSEKISSLGMEQVGRPSKRSVALAKHMIDLYACAVAALQELQSLPETKELQDTYIQYFKTAGKHMEEYLNQSDSGSTDQARRDMEEMDKTCKKLDAALRKQFGIARHRHR